MSVRRCTKCGGKGHNSQTCKRDMSVPRSAAETAAWDMYFAAALAEWHWVVAGEIPSSLMIRELPEIAANIADAMLVERRRRIDP